MPWRVTSPMYERQRFVLDAESAPCAFAELCRRYGISRKTGYKWLDRYATLGPTASSIARTGPSSAPTPPTPQSSARSSSSGNPRAARGPSRGTACCAPFDQPIPG